MKILLVTERYYPEVGAAPSRLYNMVEGLSLQNVQVNVLTTLPNYPQGKIYQGYRCRILKKEKIGSCNTYRYWIYATISPNAIKRLLNMISFAISMWLFAFNIKRCKSYDKVIIQTPTLFVATSAMILFKKLYKKQCILNVSDIWPSTAVDMNVLSKNSFAYKIMSRCEDFLYKQSDAILGQSQEILDHINIFQPQKKKFLYRNIQNYDIANGRDARHKTLKLVFAGMLGVAQDVYSIVTNINFKELNVEFHIVGRGNQYNKIQKYIEEHPNKNIFLHTAVAKEKMKDIYSKVDATIVPLTSRIYGAFPSKVFDILPMGLPILFCGGGEVKDFIINHKVGLVSEPKNYAALQNNILKLRDMSDVEYKQLSANCIETSIKELSFDKQIKNCFNFLTSI